MLSGDDEIAVRRLGKSWERAWNTHDMPALSALVAPHVDFIHAGGGWLGGRPVFEQYNTEIHATQFKESVFRVHGMAIRPLTADICVVHVNWGLSGDTGRDGMVRPSRDGIFTWVVSRHDAEWLIEASHNTNILDVVGPEHRKPTTITPADEVSATP